MDGLILVDKPMNWTSFDVVNKIRRIVQQSDYNVTHKKRYPVGHTGTLDPLATGLLVLLLGTYTKRAPALTKLDKVYEVGMRLGETSTTGDEEGTKTVISNLQPTREMIEAVLHQFVGDQLQIPPAFSAIKINGRRAYDLARQGKAVELTPRRVHIARIKLTGYAYPTVSFTAHVSSGTYIRSLVEDIGRALQTGAYMSSLRRTQVGPFVLRDAITAAQFTLDDIAAHLQTIDAHSTGE